MPAQPNLNDGPAAQSALSGQPTGEAQSAPAKQDTEASASQAVQLEPVATSTTAQSKGPQKSQDSEEIVYYCICRSKDETNAMICCDECNEWFHFTCMGIKPVSTSPARILHVVSRKKTEIFELFLCTLLPMVHFELPHTRQLSSVVRCATD